MATTAILSQDCVEAFITRETEALAMTLFCSSFGMGWKAAWDRAIDLLPDLLAYAEDWDASAGPTDSAADSRITVGSRWVIWRDGHPYEVEVLSIDLADSYAFCTGCAIHGWVPLAELTEPSPYAQEADHAQQ